jgi:alkaline phosphatase
VLAFSDHGNGGMSLGNKSTDSSYSKLPFEKLVAPLKKATLTGEGVEKALAAAGGKMIHGPTGHGEVLRIDDLTDAEVAAIMNKGRFAEQCRSGR